MKRKGLLYSFVRCLAVLVIIAAPLAVSAQSKKDKERAKRFAEQAAKAFQQKKYMEAADQYGQAVQLLPNNPEGHFWKAASYYYLWQQGEATLITLEKSRKLETDPARQKAIDGQIEQQKVSNTDFSDRALNGFGVALSQGFKPLQIYRFRAFIHYERKNYDAALEDIRKGLVLAPNDLQFLIAMGEINMDRKAFPAALDAFQKAAKLAPNDADVHYNMARVYFALGDAKAQGAEADLALSKGTRFPGESHYLLGDSRQKQGNATGAIDAYQKAINSKPDIYQAYINLAEVFRNENRFNDAITISKQGLRAFPNDGNIYTALSEFYSLAERPEDAVQAAKAGITLLPNRYLSYTNLCRAENTLRNYGDAIAACNSALSLKPDDGETNYYLGNAYVGLGRSVEATNRYTKAVSGLTAYTTVNPNLSDGWYLLGNALFADKQYDKSIEAYLKCLSLSPKFLRARVNLGIVYTRKKNKAAAVEQYNLVLPADATLAARLKAEIDKM